MKAFLRALKKTAQAIAILFALYVGARLLWGWAQFDSATSDQQAEMLGGN
jgi:hypothetical protein